VEGGLQGNARSKNHYHQGDIRKKIEEIYGEGLVAGKLERVLCWGGVGVGQRREMRDHLLRGKAMHQGKDTKADPQEERRRELLRKRKDSNPGRLKIL